MFRSFPDPLRRSALTCLVGAVLLGGMAATARADSIVILEPVSTVTDMGTSFGNLVRLRDQSGLSAGYTSSATEFDAYIASSPTHQNTGGGVAWGSAVGTPTGNVVFGLGSTTLITSMALWNRGSGVNARVVGFDLYAQSDNLFVGGTFLGSFTSSPGADDTAVAAEVFTFAGTSAAFIRMNITSVGALGTQASLGEVAFKNPEPGTFALMGLGLIVLFGARRRQKRKRAA